MIRSRPDDTFVRMQELLSSRECKRAPERDTTQVTCDSVVQSGQPVQSVETASASEDRAAARPSILVLDDRYDNLAVITAMLSGD